jgi:hypothetical protein
LSATATEHADPLAEGKASLAAGDVQRATVLFARAAAEGNTEAQELLGLAYERSSHLAQARAAYEVYLDKHPSGIDADRVRQRLMGVIAALESDAEAEFAARKKAKLHSDVIKKTANQSAIQQTDRAKKGDLIQPDQGWHWDTSGSLSQSYYRNDLYAGSGLLRGSLANHEKSQDDLVSSGDITIRGHSGGSSMLARVSVTNRTGFESSHGDETRVSSAYVDMRNKLNGLSARVGRQSRYGGGVFGRFDGALLGLQAHDQILFQIVAGSPVYYNDDSPFSDGRYFVGASLDVTSFDKRWTASLYALEQEVRSTVDRRAVGGELRYEGEPLTTSAGVDFDLFYGELNTAYASAAWQPAGDWSVYGSLDYRRVPFLLTSNALLGQPVDSLSDLFDLFGSKQSEAMAVDRTATAATATIGVTYALSQHWQAALEATVADYSGTPASGGIDAVPDPGTEYYISARLDGSDVFNNEDYASLGLTFIESDLYRSYIGDMTLRYPLNDHWRLSPRFRLAYRDARQSDTSQLLLIPSIGTSYRVSDHWSLETEVGILWERTETATDTDTRTELRLIAGYRYAF